MGTLLAVVLSFAVQPVEPLVRWVSRTVFFCAMIPVPSSSNSLTGGGDTGGQQPQGVPKVSNPRMNNASPSSATEHTDIMRATFVTGTAPGPKLAMCIAAG